MAAVLELKLKGPIGLGKSVSASLIRGQLEAAAGSFNAIHFTIDSAGGDFAESLEIYSMLRAQVFPVAATAIGQCCSGGLIIFMAAGLRKAKAGTEFQIHPTSYGRDQLLEERLTAEVLQKRADELAKMDERAINLFVDRTGYTRVFFEDEKKTEDLLSPAAVIESGLVHEMEASTPRCDSAWPHIMHKQAGHVIIPSWMKTPAYLEACRCAAYFEERPKASTAKEVPALPVRLVQAAVA
jgi:ATP-dependent protease ClpP protease subunit